MTSHALHLKNAREPVPARENFRRENTASLPASSLFWTQQFARYAERYLKKHFHTLRISIAGQPPRLNGLPLIVYGNHASWWDPLVGLVLAKHFFPGRRLYAPIDAAMLERYRFFKRLGFFGVEAHHRRGAAQFLRTSRAVLAQADAMLWLTPQGRFADPRSRPLQFKPGIGHLAMHLENAVFLPLAVEYTFWEERTPEILVRFGKPILARKGRTLWDSDEWTRQFEHNLEESLDALALESQARNPAAFQPLLHGRSGVGGVYDWWRSLRSRWRGESFSREHGTL